MKRVGFHTACTKCRDGAVVMGGTPRDPPFICPRCRKQLFAEAVLAELSDVAATPKAFVTTALVFTEKVKELAEHYKLVTP